MNSDDSEFFIEYVLSPPDSPLRKATPALDSHRKIARAAFLAAERVKSIVSGFSKPDQAQGLLRWVTFISSEAQVIWVSVNDQGNAYEIFETLNDRGAELSKSDLLKNRLFGCAGLQIEHVQQKWAAMSGTLRSVTDSDITVTYIRHLFISLNGPTREKVLYQRMKEQITSVQHAVDFAHELANSATVYAATLNSDHELWQKYGTSTRENISTLKDLKMERIRPLLLAVVLHFSVEEARKMIRRFVSWSVRLIIGNNPAGSVEQKFGEAAQKVRQETINTANKLSDELQRVIPNDIEFENRAIAP